VSCGMRGEDGGEEVFFGKSCCGFHVLCNDPESCL
jgi:hypothetical protein